MRGANVPGQSQPGTTEDADASRRVAEIRARLDQRAWRTLRTRLLQFPPALVLVGGLIFAMAAGGAFDRHHMTNLPSQDVASSQAGGMLGLKIDAVLSGLYLLAILLAYAVRRFSAPRRARQALAHTSDA